jgi:hypothetical protein
MRARNYGYRRNPLLPAIKSSGKECCIKHRCPAAALIILLFVVNLLGTRAAAQNGTFTLSSAPGSIPFAGSGTSTLSGQFGVMNALGLGTPAGGITVIPLTNGALYLTQFQLTISGLPNPHRGGVTAFVNSNFGHPAALVLEACPSTSSCNAAGSFAAISTVAGAPTTIVPAPGIDNQTVTAGLAIFLPDNNGASAFTGVDTAQVTFTATDLTNGKTFGTAQILLNTPVGETVQTAVQLTLAAATGGLSITPSADYSMNFGNVNGLGIGPGAGLTTVAAPAGVVYSTPYLLQPAFTDFSSTTATIRAFVSINFAHPTVLQLLDSRGSSGPFNTISTTAGTATQITTTAGDRSSITRFLGLFVSNVNGATAFTGSDAATLTFTLTVP